MNKLHTQPVRRELNLDQLADVLLDLAQERRHQRRSSPRRKQLLARVAREASKAREQDDGS